VFERTREEWRTNRASTIWFLAHGIALLTLTAVTLERGTVVLIASGVLVISGTVGQVVLTRHGRRRGSS
jgi:hypothetical protein